VPVVWNNRMLVFFPEFLKKNAPNAQAQGKKFSEINDSQVSDTTQQSVYWEIKLAWTERREGKWTQKQVSTDRAFHYWLTGIVWSTKPPVPHYVPVGPVLKSTSPVFSYGSNPPSYY